MHYIFIQMDSSGLLCIWYITVLICICHRALRVSLDPQESPESLVLLWVSSASFQFWNLVSIWHYESMHILPAVCDYSSAVDVCRARWVLAVFLVLLERMEKMWVLFPSLHPFHMIQLWVSSYLSSALPQGEAGKAGRPGERGSAGPQVRLTHAWVPHQYTLINTIMHTYSSSSIKMHGKRFQQSS